MNNLKILRKQNNLTQAQISKILDCSAQAYQRYEKGEREPDYNTLHKLADYFGTSIDYLLGRTDEFQWTDEEKAAGVVPNYREKLSADETEIIDMYRAIKSEKGEQATHAIKVMMQALLNGK